MQLFGRELTTEQAIGFVLISKEDASFCAKDCLIADAAIQIAEAYAKQQAELTTLRTELTTLAIETINREKTLAKLEAEVRLAARVAEERNAYKEMADGLRRERDNYKCYFDDMAAKPDCNTCADKGCQYRPRLGHTVRANCPLWRGADNGTP